MSDLVVLLNSEPIGVVSQDRRGSLTLTYDQAWRDRPDAYPLSLSMPLARRAHLNEVVHPYLEGLLPDNTDVLERWGREFQVSPRNPFALLRFTGADCAGAVQLIPPGELDRVISAPPEVEWLTEAQVGERLRELVGGHGTGRLAGDRGQFSLAGAQPKTALLHDGQRWGIPTGTIPTTHILKPPAQKNLDGFDINEHFCLELARHLGLAAAESRVRHFDGEPAIVVTRFDRQRFENGRLARLHQEDTCQALAISPLRKYENDGGPGAPAVVQLLVDQTDDPGLDAGVFLDALVFNWVIAGTDAHAKNYSLLIEPGSVRLAPLYDLVSALPYPDWIPYQKAKIAMRVDREYHIWKIRARHWRALAERCDLDAEPLLRRVLELVSSVPDAVSHTAATVRDEGLQHPIVDRLETAIREHAATCLLRLE